MTDRAKLAEEMLATFLHASTANLTASMSAAISVAEAAIRADEREMCAKVADAHDHVQWRDDRVAERVKDEIAAAIRARGEQP